jgi:hypothetical protein
MLKVLFALPSHFSVDSFWFQAVSLIFWFKYLLAVFPLSPHLHYLEALLIHDYQLFRDPLLPLLVVLSHLLVVLPICLLPALSRF